MFIESFEEKPDRLVFDFDNTDIELHGKQEGGFFHGYHDEQCFLPPYVYCEDKLATALLQPSSDDGSKHAGAVLKMLVRRVRKEWPDVRITFRGGSGFARPRCLYGKQDQGTTIWDIRGQDKRARMVDQSIQALAQRLCRFNPNFHGALNNSVFDSSAESSRQINAVVMRGKANSL